MDKNLIVELACLIHDTLYPVQEYEGGPVYNTYSDCEEAVEKVLEKLKEKGFYNERN